MALAAPLAQRARSGSKPNILFLMTDQQRGDCLGAAGNRAIRTPNLDRIAADGVRFSAAYSSTPSCTPARSGLLTGLAPWNHGMLGYGRVGQRYPVEMPRALAEAGYFTTAIGKLHYHPQRNTHGYHQALLDESGRVESVDFRSDYRAWFWSEAPNLNPDATGIGWNDYPAKAYVLPERLHPTSWTGAAAVRFLETYQRPEPFFLKVSFARPHSPYDPPSRFFRQYENADLPQAVVGKWAGRYEARSSERMDIWHGALGEAQVRESRQGYYGSISFIDEQIGRILDALDKRGWMDETLIVFTSDHGDMTGDHNLWRKCYAYEPSSHVPLLMRWPKGLADRPRGGTLPQPVELRDILPTFLDTAGTSKPVDGRSLLSLVRNPRAEWRPWIDLEHDICYAPKNHWTALTDGKRKYIYHALNGEEQLFDLERDPMEAIDLAGDPGRAAELRLWRGRMTEHLLPRGEPFVQNGSLRPRPSSFLYSPNYPKGE